MTKREINELDETRTVYIKKQDKGFTLIRNGAPFKIKGATGNSHLDALAAIGANTLRVYDYENIKSILDEAQQHNLAVIVDIPLAKYTDDANFYSDEIQIARFRDTLKKLVRTYKDHPALLFWNLGNELDYPLVLRKNEFIKTFNGFIDLIHKEDPNHPVGTSIIPSKTETLSIHLHSPQLDLIGFNAFGNLNMIKPLLNKITS
ncbi:cellulase family glycosylhydrolase [uncultured Gelidibacter sp.]|uniref:cellulase family glycosylhydrolase n=1 Tax=uncultured Gelidibacter sp. TaxID=259318 RepID=UPI00263966EA|nr:cellulase family glycosylhydrolase [uncultured Gelidibacter sp.]